MDVGELLQRNLSVTGILICFFKVKSKKKKKEEEVKSWWFWSYM